MPRRGVGLQQGDRVAQRGRPPGREHARPPRPPPPRSAAGPRAGGGGVAMAGIFARRVHDGAPDVDSWSSPCAPPSVGILMGSKSDWATMQETARTLQALQIPFEAHVASAHRTPDKVLAYCESAEARGLKVIIAAAGGAAHLAGVCAGQTLLPVLGVPMKRLGPGRHGFPPGHGADARRHPRGHPGHRQGRRGERRPPGRRHPGPGGPAAARAAARRSARPRPKRPWPTMNWPFEW